MFYILYSTSNLKIWYIEMYSKCVIFLNYTFNIILKNKEKYNCRRKTDYFNSRFIRNSGKNIFLITYDKYYY